MKKTTIRKKVSSLTITISIVAMFLVGAIAIGGLWMLRQNTITISGDLGKVAATDSQAALERQMTDRLMTLAQSKAALSDANLLFIQNSVEMMAQGAAEIINNPERFIPNPVAPPDPDNAGIMSVQFLRAEDDIDEALLLSEASLMGNMAGLLFNIIENNVDATTNYIGSEQGYIIIVDEVSYRKSEFFDPRARPWYKAAKEKNDLIWTDIFLDAYGRGLAITCAKPFHDEEGNLAGVAGIGTQLGDLTEIVVGTRVGETGYAFMLNEFGQVIIADEIELDADGNIVREDLLNSDNKALAAVASNMINGQTGIERIFIDGKEFFVAYAPLEIMPWSLATVMEVSEAVAAAVLMGESIIKLTDTALSEIDFTIIIIVGAFLVMTAMMVILIGTASRHFVGYLTQPITVLQEGVMQIAEGNLEHIIEIHTGDEIEDLGLAVNKMSKDLNEYIINLQFVTAEKERIGAELDVATKIQASMLPAIFPAFPERPEFDIYASMQPAKEVGGDFYDFFLIDNDTLAIVMADVSGKGVPAALFMVITKTLIKNNAQIASKGGAGKSPKEVFETVNNLLCEGNEADMFVTAFLGYFDIPTGKLSFVNAGHNPPLLKTGDGKYDWLIRPPGFILAGMEDMFYKQHEVSLQPGDEIFLYTDGITEAFNNEIEMFGEQRFKEAANKYLGMPLKEFTVSIKREIDKFADGAEQADDITMLVLRRS